MILDKSRLDDKSMRAFLIEKCSVGYLADYIIKLRNSLPFDEYHEFHKWIISEGWYEVAGMEYDNFNTPNSCIRLDIKELYLEYKQKSKNKDN